MSRVKLLHSERGSVLTLMIVCLTVLIGMAALAIDVGQLYVARQRAQNVCDAAALGAAQLLTGTPECTEPTAEPMVTALNCIDANNADMQAWQLQGYQVTFPTEVRYDNDPDTPVPVNLGEAIRVTGYVNVNFAFAKALGFGSKQVQASATAILRPATHLSLQPVGPIGFPPSAVDGLQFGDEPAFGTVGTWQDGWVGAGNWLSLKFPGDAGMTDYVDRLRGVTGPVNISVGDPIDTQTGSAVGEGTGGSKTYEGLVGKFSGAGRLSIAGRLNLETNPEYAPTDIYTGYNASAWDTWKASQDPATGLYDATKRILILPVVEGTTNGSSQPLQVIGFAAFFIERVSDGITPDANGNIRPIGDIEGHFIQAIVGEQGKDVGWIFPVEGTDVGATDGVRQYRLVS